MENWPAPNESEKRQRKVILITFPLGALLLIIYSMGLFRDSEHLLGWSALCFGLELLILVLFLYIRMISIRLVELTFYYSFVLFVFLIAIFNIDAASMDLPAGPYIFSAALSGLTMWVCIVFLSSYLVLSHRQNMILVMVTCGGLFAIALYHLVVFRNNFDIRYIFRWLNTFMGIGVVTVLIYYTGRLQRFYADNDVLTGVMNRRVAYDILHQACARAVRYQEVFSIISIDLDRFKQINDMLGHAAGDWVLREFTILARQSIRDVDFLGRVGGDEFLVILPTANLENAVSVAERIRIAVSGHDFHIQYPVTASFGAAMFNEDKSLEEFLNRADVGLYNAKHKGGNHVSTERE